MENRFSINLKHLRKKAGLTQNQIASELKKGQTTIGNWETGFSQPSLEELVVLTRFFGVSTDEILFGDFDDVHLSQKKGGRKKTEESTPKCTPNSTPNDPKNAELSHGHGIIQDLKSAEIVLQAKDQVIQSQMTTIELQKILIDSINQRVREIQEENERLKREVPEISGHVEGHSGRGGKKQTA